MGSMKKKDWYYNKGCNHGKNRVELAIWSCGMIAQQVMNKIARKKACKVVQFAIVSHFIVVGLSHVKIWVFTEVIVWVFNSSNKQQKTLD